MGVSERARAPLSAIVALSALALAGCARTAGDPGSDADPQAAPLVQRAAEIGCADQRRAALCGGDAAAALESWRSERRVSLDLILVYLTAARGPLDAPARPDPQTCAALTKRLTGGADDGIGGLAQEIAALYADPATRPPSVDEAAVERTRAVCEGPG
ncbi:MAG: hypothetical protein AAFW46_00195 [Pseudomonadota bacterium]